MTPEDIAFHLHHLLGPLARMLGWSPEQRSYHPILTRIRVRMETDDLDTIEDRTLLLAVAERELWKRVVEATAGFHTISTADGERRDRKQIHDQALVMLRQAERAEDLARGDLDVRVQRIQRTDLYTAQPFAPAERWAWWDKR